MKLSDIRKLIDNAMPGPWEYGNQGVWNMEIDGDGNSPCSVAEYVSEKDGRLIAASRTLLPKLLAVAEAAEASCKELLEAHENDPYSCAAHSATKLEAALDALEKE